MFHNGNRSPRSSRLLKATERENPSEKLRERVPNLRQGQDLTS